VVVHFRCLKLRELLRQDRDFVGVLRGGRLDCQCSGDRDQDIGDCIEAVRRRRVEDVVSRREDDLLDGYVCTQTIALGDVDCVPERSGSQSGA
jgi:hypothetical protein